MMSPSNIKLSSKIRGMLIMEESESQPSLRLKFPLNSSVDASSTIILRNVSDTLDCVAFRIRTSHHEERYTIHPSEGITYPNSDTILTIKLHDKDVLEGIHNALGQEALDLDRAELVFESCIVEGGTELREDYFALESCLLRTTRVQIDHYVDGYSFIEVGESRGNVIQQKIPYLSGMWPFPDTETVRSIYADIKASSASAPGPLKTCCFCVGCLGTFFLSCFTTFYTSILPLFIGMRSLRCVIADNGRLTEDELQKFKQNSMDIEGRALKRIKRDNPAHNEEQYFVRLEYESSDDTGDVRTCVTDYSSRIPSHRAHELYEMTECSSTVDMQILPSCPTSGIPTFLLDGKLKSVRLWANIVHPLRAVLGLGMHLGLTFWGFAGVVSGMLPNSYVTLPCAVICILLMIPACLQGRNDRIELSARLVQVEPISIPTEGESLKNSTLRRGLILYVLASIGLMSCVFMSLLALYLFPVLLWQVFRRSTSSRWRDCLERFRNSSVQVTGTTDYGTSRTEEGYHGNNCTRTISYEMPYHGNTYTLEREFKNDMRCTYMVLNSHPRSGHPNYKIEDMREEANCSAKPVMLIILGPCIYIWGHWFSWYSDDALFETHPEGKYMIIDWILTFIAPFLMIPFLLMAREKYISWEVDRLLNGAKVVGVREGCQNIMESGAQQHIFSKGIPIEREESSHTFTTELIDEAMDDDQDQTASLELV